MKKLTLIVLVFFIASMGTALAEDKKLNIYIWSEYMDPEMPAAFEKLTGIKVRVDLYESIEEAMAKLQAGGVSQYDIIVPPTYSVLGLIKLKLLQPLDHSKIPNLKNIGSKFMNIAEDPGNKYSVPYQWGSAALGYRKDRVKAAEAQSWDILFDPQHDQGPFFLLDSMQEMIGITLVYLGYDFNSVKPKEIKEAVDLLIKTKKRKSCLGFKGGVGALADMIGGVANSAFVYGTDAIRAMDSGEKNLAYVIPKEGAEIWMDNLCITAKAPHPDAAHKWINWILDPKIGAWLATWVRAATPNDAAKAHLSKEDLKNTAIYPPPETLDLLHFGKDLGKDMRLWDEAWTRVKAQ